MHCLNSFKNLLLAGDVRRGNMGNMKAKLSRWREFPDLFLRQPALQRKTLIPHLPGSNRLSRVMQQGLFAMVLFFAMHPLSAENVALHFGNGLKIGEVGPTSAIVWTRLTALPEILQGGREFVKAGDHATAEAQLGGHSVNEFTGAMPGASGDVRLVYWVDQKEDVILQTEWTRVDEAHDFTHQFKLSDLRPGTRYRIRAEARSDAAVPSTATWEGTFRTAPSPEDPVTARFTVVTCQDFPRRDNPAKGHTIYHSMLDFHPDFFIHTGDNEYFDKAGPWATRLDLARFKWNRIAALPFQREFHRQVPAFFMKDDHDTTKDDASPGQAYGELTWDQGLALFLEQVPIGETTHRRFRWGSDLEVWLLEGRDFRSPNQAPDGPGKTILGPDQKRWLKESLAASDATFRIVISPTPIVGPDRGSKNDNHANRGFNHEGDELRSFLASLKNTVVICGDRHWQYVSRHAATGLLEFSTGSTSPAHAGGFRLEDRTPEHLYLAIIGGFLSGEVSRPEGTPTLTLRHHSVDGKVVNEMTLPATP